MALIDIIEPSSVRVLHGVTSKKRLFQSLAALAAPMCTVKQDVMVQALVERENLGPTGVGHGVALPHARLDDVDQIFGCFVKLDAPIEFGAVDRQPVDLAFALFAPQHGGVDHLKALASVSRMLRNPQVCEKLRSNDDPATLYEILVGDAMATVAA